jgi:hypothetical protein
MRKKMICGVCAIAFLLFLTPMIPAQQYTQVKKTMIKEFQQQLERTFDTMRSMKEDDSQKEGKKQSILVTFNTQKNVLEMKDLDAKPTCFKFVISTLLSLIFALLGTIFGMIFGPLLALIVKVITFPAVLLAKIIVFLLNGNDTTV